MKYTKEMKYKIYLFDLDNTLLDFEAAAEKSIRITLSHFGVNPTDDVVNEYKGINSYYWMEFEKGRIKKEELLVRRFKDFFSKYLDEDHNSRLYSDESEVNDFYLNQLSMCNDMMPNALELVSKLKDKDVKIYVVTNGVCKTQERRLRTCPLSKYFDDVFISELIGYQKPKKEYFDYVFKAIKKDLNVDEIDKREVLIVGDSIGADILGGQNYGLDTCWYNPKNQKSDVNPTYNILDLLDILEL